MQMPPLTIARKSTTTSTSSSPVTMIVATSCRCTDDRHRQKYSIPYNGEEVTLHWANKDQYYIKTGEFFNNYAFRIGNYQVHFHISNAETTHNNTKAAEKRVFVLRTEDPVTSDPKTKELTAFFEYRPVKDEDGVAKEPEIYRKSSLKGQRRLYLVQPQNLALKPPLPDKVNEKNTLLRKHLFTYTRRNTTDYFIHKRLKAFLTEELDFFTKNEMFRG